MYEVRVEGGFAAAHRLLHYNGKCERLHGHNYKVRIWAKGSSLGEGGMLVDFSMKLLEPGLPLSAVEVFETETSMARYSPD